MKDVNEKTVSLNLRPYCNLLYPYASIEEVDKESVLEDVKFWADVLISIDSIMNVKSNVVETVPDDIDVITECPKCGGSNLKFTTGQSKANGKTWYGFDCQDCVTERGGQEYPTRTFTRKKPISSGSELFGLPDDDDAPF